MRNQLSKNLNGRPSEEGRPLVHSVLELIWRQVRISRADIARRTGLSRSTVSEIVATLLRTGLVAEVGEAPSRGGRRPILLEFQDDAYGILGVDMGATHVAVALTNLRGEVSAWEHQGHPVRTDPEGTESLILELCDRCLSAVKGARRRLLGIGLAVPARIMRHLWTALKTIKGQSEWPLALVRADKDAPCELTSILIQCLQGLGVDEIAFVMKTEGAEQ